MVIRKRDGREVDYDKHKIRNALYRAFSEVDGEVTKVDDVIITRIVNKIDKYIASNANHIFSVEEIQDIVEDKLMMSNRKDVAKAYVIYRHKHENDRLNYQKMLNLIDEKINAKNVQNQNANVDEMSFGGRVGETSDAILKEYALNYLMTFLESYNHVNNLIYTHDLSHYPVGDHNCLTIPFDPLLAKGFKVKQTDIRPAQGVYTALQLIPVIFQIQSLQQFGGCSASHIDWTLVPYMRKSFMKHYIIAWLKDNNSFTELNIVDLLFDTYKDEAGIIRNKFDDWVDENKHLFFDMTGLKEEDFFLDNKDNLDKKYYQSALYDTICELKQGVESLYHNLNSLQSRAGNQLPFTSINYGTCTLTEGRLVIKTLLDVLIHGIGAKNRTSIFPCGIFQIMSGVNKEKGTPNYDLKRLALQATALRLYPNYANCDWSVNAGYDKNDPTQYVSTMGCVDGEEVITYRYNGNLYVESFRRMWNRLADYFENKEQIIGNKNHLYLDVNNKVEIYDTEKGFVNVKRVIRNTSTEWLDINIEHGRRLLCTTDHPFHTERGRVYANELTTDDVVNINPNQFCDETMIFNDDKAWLLGFILCDGCYDGHLSVSIALNSENDIENAYIKRMKEQFNNEVETVVKNRGIRGNYKDLVSRGSITEIIDYISTKFEGLTKNRRHIPNEVFSWNYSAKLSFLAGMIDADGYINPTTHGGSVIQLGSTNKELALQQMALAQSLGMTCNLYHNHYSTKKPNAIRYRVEFVPCEDLLQYIVSNKKIENYVEKENVHTHYKARITEINKVDMVAYSYDVTTDSDHFEVSGIYSHNCRTYNGYDINGLGFQKDGRGNIAPNTIIMPEYAMIAKENCKQYENDSDYEHKLIDEFMKVLEKAIEESKDELLIRFYRIASQPMESARFMYENNVMAGYIPEEGIISALKHGTLAIGQLGLAETLEILVGCNHLYEKGMNLAKQIEALFNKKANEYKHQYHLNFGVYYTPSENLCYTAMEKFKKKHGIIEKVSDKDFFTNSIHVPVWEHVDPFTKIDIESQLTGYSNAGSITYVELDSSVLNNINALEEIVDYAMDKDIPYFAINVPNDMCEDCGFTSEINDNCPICGSDNISRLRRVTGYLSTDYHNFNKGKQQEVEMRYQHSKMMKGDKHEIRKHR